MTKYRYLLFDVDNTLMDFDRAEHDAMWDTLKDQGYEPSEALIADYSKINDAHWKMLERGEIDRPTLMWKRFEAFADACGLADMDGKAFNERYVHNLSQKSYLLDGALEVCERLAKDYCLCAITNGNTKVQKGRFLPSPLYPLFAKCFISDEMGCAKPSQEFFDMVCAELPDLRPEQALVIGDSLTSDIAGGIRWGTDTCWYCPPSKQDKAKGAKELPITYRIERLEQLLDILL